MTCFLCMKNSFYARGSSRENGLMGGSRCAGTAGCPANARARPMDVESWCALANLEAPSHLKETKRKKKQKPSWDWNIGWYWMFSAGTMGNNFYFRTRSWWTYHKTFPSKGSLLSWKHFHECQEFLTISLCLLTPFFLFLATCQLRCICLPHSPLFAVNFKELWVKLIIHHLICVQSFVVTVTLQIFSPIKNICNLEEKKWWRF